MAITYPVGSPEYGTKVFITMLESHAGEKISIHDDVLANGINIYFEKSHVGISIGKEEIYRCENNYEKTKDLVKAAVKRRDDYIMDLGRAVLEEKAKLAKTPKYDRNYNDRPERRKK